MATLSIPPVLTSPRDDAVHLYRAFKGFGCDTEAVVNILAHRDATQRALIEQEYRAMYSEDLNKRLVSELKGDLEKAILLWMPDPATRDATIVRKALTGDVIDLNAVTEVICSRTSSQIQHFKQIYHAKFHAILERDIEYQATGDHKTVDSLIPLLYTDVYLCEHANERVTEKFCCSPTLAKSAMMMDRARAEHDAKSLFKAGEKKLGTDEKIFIRIFSESSGAHLAAVSSAYHHMYGNSLKKAVKSETSGNFRFGLLTILQCAENPAKYFAKVLHEAMKGIGTNDTTLIRVIVTRAEIDMQYIKAEYHKKYGKTLNDAVHSETSSHYRTFLLSLLGATHR